MHRMHIVLCVCNYISSMSQGFQVYTTQWMIESSYFFCHSLPWILSLGEKSEIVESVVGLTSEEIGWLGEQALYSIVSCNPKHVTKKRAFRCTWTERQPLTLFSAFPRPGIFATLSGKAVRQLSLCGLGFPCGRDHSCPTIRIWPTYRNSLNQWT